MQFLFLALLSLCAVASATAVRRHAQAQPSASSHLWYSCPEKDTEGHRKVSKLSDSPPHSGSVFGCTYETGRGTGIHSCIYNSDTGELSRGSKCPKTAIITRPHKKRDSNTF